MKNWTLGENKPNSNPIKPNFQKAKMNVNLTLTKDYIKNDDFTVRINKPNSNPISVKPKMNVNLYFIEDYENETAFRPKKNKPKTNPIKACPERSRMGQSPKGQNERKIACQKIRPHPSRGCAKNCLQKRPFWLYSSGLSGYGGLRPDQSDSRCKERIRRWRKMILI
jgi:hypothetical protein